MDKAFVTIKYITADGKRIDVKVSVAVRDLLAQTDRKIRSQGRQDRRYLDKGEYIDGLTDTAIVCPGEDIADLVCRMDSYERLYTQIEKLPEVQRRRLRLYYNDELTCRQIAELENVHHTTISRSLKSAIAFLRKYFTD